MPVRVRISDPKRQLRIQENTRSIGAGMRNLFNPLCMATVLSVHPAAALAQERASSARHELWLSWSATLLLGSIAGSFALKAAALDDRVDLLPRNTRERPDAQEDSVSAHRLAWGFGSAASLMAVTSVLIWVYQPSLPAEPGPALTPVLSASQLGVTYHGRF
jgi:hypothetical protein